MKKSTGVNRGKAAVSLAAAASIGAGACGSSGGASPDNVTTTSRPSTTTTAPDETTTTPTTVASVATTAKKTTRASTTTTTQPPLYGCGPVRGQEDTTTTTSTPTTTSTDPPSSTTTVTAMVVCGRPYRRRRRGLMLPDVTDLGAREAQVPTAIEAMPDQQRVTVGQTWLGDARSEAASVPAFAELALHLAAVGAPHDLVRRAHEAAIDEIRHAEACLELASSLLGRRFELGALPEIAGRRVAGRSRWSRRRHLAKLAVDSLLDGCVSEGNSADHLRARAAKSVPEVSAVAIRLAADEDRHTELAWDIVAWCKTAGGAFVEGALAEALRRLPARDVPPAVARRYYDLDSRVPELIPQNA